MQHNMQQPDSIIKINNNNMPQRGVKGRIFEKMKKFLSSALVLLLVLVGLFAMTGCDSKPVLRLYN